MRFFFFMALVPAVVCSRGQLGYLRWGRLGRWPLLSGVAVFLFDLSPGSRAVPEPEPGASGASLFLVIYLKIIEVTFPCAPRGCLCSSASASAARGARPVLIIWLGLRASYFHVATYRLCFLVVFS